MTKDFYFFSHNHTESFIEREWESNYNNYEFPNMTHCISFDYSKWAMVPMKSNYKNDIFLFDKPLLIIANKYNIEWDNLPINYFSIPLLDKIINSLREKYTIIYNRPAAKYIVPDNSETLDLQDFAWLQETHPEVILMSDLYKKHKDNINSFNHLQLLVYANCDNFISVHGGTAAFASYFEGKNIIFSKKGIEHVMNEFNTIFPKLSGATIFHATTEEKILEHINNYY